MRRQKRNIDRDRVLEAFSRDIDLRGASFGDVLARQMDRSLEEEQLLDKKKPPSIIAKKS